jgi:hypothetical protein
LRFLATLPIIPAMQRSHRFICAAVTGPLWGVVMALYALPSPGLAAELPPAKVVISELQTGQASASDEFVELYNLGSTPVDVAGWQLRYRNADATGTETTLLAALPGSNLLLPGAYLVVHTTAVAVPAGTLAVTYDASLSVADKTIGLYEPHATTCTLTVHDAVAWGSASQGESTAVSVPANAVQVHMERFAPLADTNSNAVDFSATGAAAGQATPGAPGTSLRASSIPMAAVSTSGNATLPEAAMPGCVVPGSGSSPLPPSSTPPPAAPVAPQSPPPVVHQPASADEETVPAAVAAARNPGLYAPQISELLPNPAKPQTDATHEYIELYNANAAVFDLSGFVLEAGKKHYTFPEGTVLPPKTFRAFYTKDTKLSLANTTGQVRLWDPFEREVAVTDVYQTAKDGQAWIAADKIWQWTVSPTPDAINIVHAPATKKKAAATAASAKTSLSTGSTAGTVRGASSTQAPDQASKQPVAGQSEESFNPLHPGILAVTGVIAVLYGIYEYRHDLANKLYQLRANRSLRRKTRQPAKGRGSR